MAFFAVFVPVVMLGVMVALGRYEELMLPTVRNDAAPRRRSPAPAREPHPQVTAGPGDGGRGA
jgi:hypothetical protein